MIVFENNDTKILSLKDELILHDIQVDGVKAMHPILSPFYVLKLIFRKKKIKVFVFRYLGDSNSLILAVIRYLSNLLTILIAKIYRIEIWWLCHNVDKETHEFYPKIVNLRRQMVAKYSTLILTTNELLVPKALRLFPQKRIDSISLGYMEDGALNVKENREAENSISDWILQRKNHHSKFIFCIGSPAIKCLHFDRISDFIQKLNETSSTVWYAIVVGTKVQQNEFIYNVPFKCVINKQFIKNHADFYYRVMNDFSMSYTTYEAVHYRIPIITENYGILPELIEKYKIGIVIHSNCHISKQIENYKFDENNFVLFETENNWKIAAEKINSYYKEI